MQRLKTVSPHLTRQFLATLMEPSAWGPLKAGTYLYQSGSFPSLQVPMGLYGALVVHQNATEAYAGVSPEAESILFFSEVDPLQNNRVDTAAMSDEHPPGRDFFSACASPTTTKAAQAVIRAQLTTTPCTFSSTGSRR